MASDAQRAELTPLIDDILAASDLETISAKRIRKALQEKLSYDITDQKAPINDLIGERFDRFRSSNEAPTTNGASKEASASVEPKASATPAPPSESPAKRKAEAVESDELSDVADATPPPKKAKKSAGGGGGGGVQRKEAEDDAAYARRLQAELDTLNARPTRGGGSRRRAAPTPKTKTKKKSKTKISSDDDSDVSTSQKKDKPKKGGFHKPMQLSQPLSDLLGVQQLSRPQTVKQIWAYVKERELQDPNDKRQIRCDEAMRAVFKSDKVHMFTMNKVLAQHLYPVEEGQEVVAPEEEVLDGEKEVEAEMEGVSDD